MVQFHTSHVKSFLDKSYETKKSSRPPTGYKKDTNLSGKRVQVYSNNEGKSVVVHRGTAGFKDIITDMKFSLNKKAFKSSDRYQHSKRIQEEAHKKYGKHNTTTMGHSLGGALAENVGRKSDKVITVNKAASLSPYSKKIPKNQVDIYSKKDLVSKLSHHHGGKKVVIEAKTRNPLTEHKVNILDRVSKVV